VYVQSIGGLFDQYCQRYGVIHQGPKSPTWCQRRTRASAVERGDES
jgi:hypothetical protein